MAIFGVQPYGVGTPAVAQDGGGEAITNPYTGAQNGSRKIDPYTRDYVFNSTTGRIQGMTTAQQLVYLAVSTEKGSSAMRALGQELGSIERITSNFARRVDDLLRSAVQPIVNRGLIVVTGTEVKLVRPGVAFARLKWRDLETGEEEATPIGHIDPTQLSPLLIILNYDLADSAGGTSIVIIGVNLADATSCTVGGTSATITKNTPTSLTFTMPAKAAGTYSVVVTTPQGTSNSLTIEAWAPADLGVTSTGLWGPNYSGTPWVGTAGGGLIAGNLGTDISMPATSASLNGYTGADFSGTQGLTFSPTAASYYWGAGATYAMVALVKVDSFAVADPGVSAPYSAPAIFGDGTANNAPHGGVAGSGSSGVFRWGHYNGSSWNSAACTIYTGVWTMMAARYDGTNISVARNGTAFTSVAHSAPSSLSNALRVGPNSTRTAQLDGQMMYGALLTSLTDANRDKFRRYFNSKFALSL